MTEFKIMVFCEKCGGVTMVPFHQFHAAMRTNVSITMTCEACRWTENITTPMSMPPPPPVPPIKQVNL